MFYCLKNWLESQPRWVMFKAFWKAAPNKSEKVKALVFLSNGLANMTFPFKVRHHKTGVLLRWEAAYDEISNEAEKVYPEGKDSFKIPQVFWWRQFWHLLGGFIVGLSNLASIALFWSILLLTLPWLPFGFPVAVLLVQICIWGIILFPFLVVLTIGALIGYKEFTSDLSRNKWKNYIDTAFWMIGASIWILILL